MNKPLIHSPTFNDSLADHGYRTHLKPYVARLLSAIGLDVVYQRAEGDWLYVRDEAGNEQAVLDMVGGFGAGLLGHNHPELVAAAQAVLLVQRPFLAQASVRTIAGQLAQRLATIAEAATGQTFIVTLANSGAEAVEAALKHAEMCRQERIHDFLEGEVRSVRAVGLALNEGRLTIPECFFEQAAAQLGVAEIEDLAQLGYFLTETNRRQLLHDPFFLAVTGSFHGKSSGAVKLTYSPDFRKPWHDFGIRSEFVARDDEVMLDQINRQALLTCYRLVWQAEGALTLVAHPWSRLVGCIAEPIQGEGGIHELSPAFLQRLRTVATEANVPLILDEIQSGMGRTGEFFASSAQGVVGDYYLLSKTLGGGLAKQAALLIRRDHYIEEFGYLHTSTFAEDDFSAAISLATLDLLQRDNWALLAVARRTGDQLLAKLRDLQITYPQVIHQIRGRGLMIGIELIPQLDSASNLFRVASEQKLLGFLISGYLLHEAAIRIAPTLSANNTIRLEPSVWLDQAEIDHFCSAFASAVAAIARADAHVLPRHVAGEGSPLLASPRGGTGSARTLIFPPKEERTVAHGTTVPSLGKARVGHKSLRRVACVAHFIQPEDLLHWDPTLAPLSPAACDRLLQRTSRVLDPFWVDTRIIEGQWGERVELGVVGLPMSASQLMARVRRGESAAVLEEIEEAVALAKRWGATLIGFAGYTSIITNNCQALVEDQVGLTSGNSLTAATALLATQQAAADLGIDWAQAALGIVGAVGNIGRVIGEMEAARVGSLLLCGRAGTESRLQRLADTFVSNGAKQIGVSSDLATLQHCNVIISASNAPEPLITPAHLNAHPTVICDVAVPGDVAETVHLAMPHVRVIKGGIIQLPGNQEISIRGMALAQDDAYACIAEVILLGLAGIRHHFSYGALRAERVAQIGTLAKQYGFGVRVRER